MTQTLSAKCSVWSESILNSLSSTPEATHSPVPKELIKTV